VQGLSAPETLSSISPPVLPSSKESRMRADCRATAPSSRNVTRPFALGRARFLCTAPSFPTFGPSIGNESTGFPAYDAAQLSIEIELFARVVRAVCRRRQPCSGAKATFVNLGAMGSGLLATRPVAVSLLIIRQTFSGWRARSHLPMWGVLIPGLCLGHPAYDVVSLLQTHA